MVDNKLVHAESVTLLGVALAGAIAIVIGGGTFNFWTSLVGLVLVLVLIGHGSNPEGLSPRQNLAFSAVFALCVIQVFGILIDILDVKSVRWFGEFAGYELRPIEHKEAWRIDPDVTWWIKVGKLEINGAFALMVWAVITVVWTIKRQKKWLSNLLPF